MGFDVSANDFQQGYRKASSMARGLIDDAQAVGESVVAEMGKIVDPLTHAIEQPIQGLEHTLSNANQTMRWGVMVAGGWLLYTVLSSQMTDYVDTKMQMEMDPYNQKYSPYGKRQRIR